MFVSSTTGTGDLAITALQRGIEAAVLEDDRVDAADKVGGTAGSAAFASWSRARRRARGSPQGSVSNLSRAAPRLAASATSRCCAPSCRSQYRSAVVRIPPCGPRPHGCSPAVRSESRSSASPPRPNMDRAMATRPRATARVTWGATTSPATPTSVPDRVRPRSPTVTAEVRRVARQHAEVKRQAGHGDRTGPGGDDEREADRGGDDGQEAGAISLPPSLAAAASDLGGPARSDDRAQASCPDRHPEQRCGSRTLQRPALERSRAAALLGVTIPDTMPALDHPTWLGRLGQRGRSKRRWQEIAHTTSGHHHLLGRLRARRPPPGPGRLAMAGAPAVHSASLPRHAAHFYLFTARGLGLHPARARWSASLGLVLIAPPRHPRRSLDGAGRHGRGPCSGGGARRRGSPTRIGAAGDAAGRRPSTPRRPNAGGATATSTTARSSAWSALAANLGSPRGASSTTRIPDASRAVARRTRIEEAKAALQRDPRPRPRHPPGDPRGPRARRRAVGRGRPLADPGLARASSVSPTAAGRDRERRVLRGRQRRSPTSPATRGATQCRGVAGRPRRRARS